jgi:rhamnopyranosyl-N-acetylglucosaminyl-diphospho-decaprenol beta-1,3/1,4-galactofuranosyltransferase
VALMARILGNLLTYNDAAVIDTSLGAMLGQSRPLDEILIVDNGSTDDTLARSFPAGVKVVHFADNRFTSGAIHAAMRYGLEHHFDWIWVVDGDSAPRATCLADLLAFHAELASDVRDATWLLAALPIDADGHAEHGFVVTRSGLRRPQHTDAPYECDATIWSGSLYRLAAVAKVGLPRIDYALDVAEVEYGHRGRGCGWRAFVVPSAIVDHNLDGPSMRHTQMKIGPWTISLIELPAVRCYYVVRNVLHFCLYDCAQRSLGMAIYAVLKSLRLTAHFAVRPFSHRAELGACLRGWRDGLAGRLPS